MKYIVINISPSSEYVMLLYKAKTLPDAKKYVKKLKMQYPIWRNNNNLSIYKKVIK